MALRTLSSFRWQMYILMGDFANNVFKRRSKGEIYVHMWQNGMGEGGRANSLADNTKGCVRERKRGSNCSTSTDGHKVVLESPDGQIFFLPRKPGALDFYETSILTIGSNTKCLVWD